MWILLTSQCNLLFKLNVYNVFYKNNIHLYLHFQEPDGDRLLYDTCTPTVYIKKIRQQSWIPFWIKYQECFTSNFKLADPYLIEIKYRTLWGNLLNANDWKTADSISAHTNWCTI